MSGSVRQLFGDLFSLSKAVLMVVDGSVVVESLTDNLLSVRKEFLFDGFLDFLAVLHDLSGEAALALVVNLVAVVGAAGVAADLLRAVAVAAGFLRHSLGFVYKRSSNRQVLIAHKLFIVYSLLT